jgi:hypothetical protein
MTVSAQERLVAVETIEAPVTGRGNELALV